MKFTKTGIAFLIFIIHFISLSDHEKLNISVVNARPVQESKMYHSPSDPLIQYTGRIEKENDSNENSMDIQNELTQKHEVGPSIDNNLPKSPNNLKRSSDQLKINKSPKKLKKEKDENNSKGDRRYLSGFRRGFLN